MGLVLLSLTAVALIATHIKSFSSCDFSLIANPILETLVHLTRSVQACHILFSASYLRFVFIDLENGLQVGLLMSRLLYTYSATSSCNRPAYVGG